MNSGGLEDQIKTGKYNKTTEGATMKDFQDMVAEILFKNKPTEEFPLIFVMDGYTIKNTGVGLFILCENDEWVPCEIDHETKKITIP